MIEIERLMKRLMCDSGIIMENGDVAIPYQKIVEYYNEIKEKTEEELEEKE